MGRVNTNVRSCLLLVYVTQLSELVLAATAAPVFGRSRPLAQGERFFNFTLKDLLQREKRAMTFDVSSKIQL